jgi:large subunit ribosomal protein L5e
MPMQYLWLHLSLSILLFEQNVNKDSSLFSSTVNDCFDTGSIKTVLQLLRDDEPEKYQAHFSGLVKEGFEANNLAEMYTSVHVAIHADPTAQTTEKRAPSEKKTWKMKKLSYGEPKAALISQLNAPKEQDDQ